MTVCIAFFRCGTWERACKMLPLREPCDADFQQFSPLSLWTTAIKWKIRAKKNCKINWCVFFPLSFSSGQWDEKNEWWVLFLTKCLCHCLHAVVLILMGFKHSNLWSFNQIECIQCQFFCKISNPRFRYRCWSTRIWLNTKVKRSTKTTGVVSVEKSFFFFRFVYYHFMIDVL